MEREENLDLAGLSTPRAAQYAARASAAVAAWLAYSNCMPLVWEGISRLRAGTSGEVVAGTTQALAMLIILAVLLAVLAALVWFMKSRIAAIVLLLLAATQVILTALMMSGLSLIFGILMALVAVQSVRGSFAWHRFRRAISEMSNLQETM